VAWLTGLLTRLAAFGAGAIARLIVNFDAGFLPGRGA
jgi:hypothetical protein